MITLFNLLPEAGQAFAFDWVSLIFLVVLLAAVFDGIRKGFVRSLLSFFAILIAFALAYFLAKPMANWLYGVNGWGSSLTTSFSDFFLKSGAEHPFTSGNATYDAMIKTYFGSLNPMEWVVSKSDLQTVLPGAETTVLNAAMSSVSLPSFLDGYVRNFVLNAVPETAAYPLSIYLGQSAASLLLIAISFAALFILFWIVVKIMAVLIGKALSHVPMVRWLDKLLGAFFGVFVALIDISLLSSLLVSLSSIPAFYSFLDTSLKLSDPTIYTIGKAFYNNNLVEYLLGYFSSWIPALSSPASSSLSAFSSFLK